MQSFLPDDEPELFGDQERAVGQRKSGGGFNEGVIQAGQNDVGNDPAQQQSHCESTGGHDDEVSDRITDGEFLRSFCHRNGDGECDHGDCVVEQRLTLDQDAEALWNPSVLKNATTATGSVAEMSAPNAKARAQGMSSTVCMTQPNDERAKGGADQCDVEHIQEVGFELCPRKVKRGFKEQWGHQQGEDEFGVDVHATTSPSNAAKPPAMTNATVNGKLARRESTATPAAMARRITAAISCRISVVTSSPSSAAKSRKAITGGNITDALQTA